MKVNSAVIAAECRKYMPFLLTTTVMMNAVKKGMGREDAHEVIKEHAVATANDMRAGKISENDLLARLAADPRMPLDAAELEKSAKRVPPQPASPKPRRRIFVGGPTSGPSASRKPSDTARNPFYKNAFRTDIKRRIPKIFLGVAAFRESGLNSIKIFKGLKIP